MDWAQILVIILSTLLAVFLLLSIVLVVLLIRVTRQIKSVTSSAGRTMGHVETVITGLTSITSPLVLANMVKKSLKKARK